MKRISLMIGALALTPGVAHAQSRGDVTFSGVKIGASVDYRWNDGDFALPSIAGKVDEKKGAIGYRGHVGYDAQIGTIFVIGAEGGIGRGGGKLSAVNTIGDYTLKPDWTWDISGRAGILPAQNVLLYGRVGRSWLRVREKTDFRATNLRDLDTSGTEGGFLWGGGVETGLAPGIFARAEYDHVNYGDGLTSSKIQLGMSVGF